MRRSLVTAPTVEPLLLEEVKDQRSIMDDDSHDALLDALIVTAREWAESFTNRALITQTWDIFLDGFPGVIEVPYAPLQSVTSITYVDTAQASQTLATSVYEVSSQGKMPGCIRPKFGQVWPSTYSQYDAVTVRIVAGYGDSWNDVPIGLRQAMHLYIGELFERREDSVVGTIVSVAPLSSKALASSHRVWSF